MTFFSNSNLTNLDTKAPSITLNPNLPSSITKGDSYAILGNYSANGPSGGSASCSSNRNGTVTNTSALTTVGSHTITCTATSGAGKTASASKIVQITYSPYNATNLVTNGSFENGIDEWGNRNINATYMSGNFSIFGIQKYGNNTFRIEMINDAQVFARANYPNANNLQGHKVYAKVSTYREATNAIPGIYTIFGSGPGMWDLPQGEVVSWIANSPYVRQWVDVSTYTEYAPYNYVKPF